VGGLAVAISRDPSLAHLKLAPELSPPLVVEERVSFLAELAKLLAAAPRRDQGGLAAARLEKVAERIELALLGGGHVGGGQVGGVGTGALFSGGGGGGVGGG